MGYLTISRPEALNALNIEMLGELEDVLTKIDGDEDLGAVVVTGEGRAFIAGADIAEMKRLTAAEGRDMVVRGHRVMSLIEQNRRPFIAAVNGYALGGGNELAMACDIRIASDRAKFGQPEAGLGIIPGYGGTQRLPRLVGLGMAKKLIFSGDIIDAQEALRIGLVDQVVPGDELMTEASALAEKIAANAPIAVRIAKSAINKGMQCDIETAVRMEIECFTAPFSSEDRAEGMSAFLEKRKADFRNR